MHASASLPALALLSLVVFTSPVAAQEITLTVATIADRTHSGAGVPYVSAAECSGNVTIRSSVTQQLDIWRGAANSNCQTASNRSSTTNTTCTWVAHVTSFDNNVFSVAMSALTAGSTNACMATDAASQGQTFEFVAIQTPTERDTSTSSPFGKFSLRIDPASPVAPTVDEDDRHRLGESVSVGWKAPTGELEQITYRVYTDTSGTCSEDGTPSSTLLTPGSAPPGDLDFRTASGTSATVSASDVGAEIGSSVVVAVAAVDIAGNVSKLSPLICVSFVETVGFCDGDMPECHENCAVATPGAGGGARGLVMLSALACAALVVHARRRRSAP